MAIQPSTLLARCGAEVLGTFILVFFGCGAVHTAVLLGAQSGLWQVAIVWGVAVTLAVYVVGGISGAHINPAITVALAAWSRFSWQDVGPYIASQVAGGFLAAGVLFIFFEPYLAEKERQKEVRRGEPGSEVTAMCYGEYFPSPGGLATDPKISGTELQNRLREQDALVPHGTAFLVEVVATSLLALLVFALTDERNLAAPTSGLGPAFIGLTVAVLISVAAPLTQACFNPARDFGPRLFACIAGWGTVAIPGPRGMGWFTVYILAPIVGACIGGGLYTLLLRPALPAAIPEGRVKPETSEKELNIPESNS